MKIFSTFSATTTDAQLTLENSNWANTITNDDDETTDYSASGYGHLFVSFLCIFSIAINAATPNFKISTQNHRESL